MTEPENSEELPESPELGAAVQLDGSETLDGAPGTDGLDAGVIAPSRPYALDDPAMTGDEETLDDRLGQEIPDDAPDAASGPRPDQTPGEIGSEAGQGRSGRLTSDDGLEGVALDAMEADDVGISGGAASAEEAAVHEIDEDEIPADDLVEAPGPEAPEGPDVRLRGDDVDPASGVPGESR